MRRLAALIVLLVALAAPAAASAHAMLESTTPARGASVDRAPRAVVFRFSESVEAAFGAVRVYDARGNRVDNEHIVRPGGRQSQIGVGLKPGLGDGAYTATYRVISADGHPVSGGVVFQVGDGGAATGASVDELLSGTSAGTATAVAFGIDRAIAYAALALGLGGLLFLVLTWLRALAEAAGAEPRWREAVAAFGARWRTVWVAAAVAGIVTAALGLVFQTATAGGTSFWAAMDPSAIREVLDTRAGRGWLARLVAWVALAVVVAVVARREREVPAVGRVALGADGLAVARPSRGALIAVGVVGLALAATPALAGHASVQPPVALLFPLDVIHVLGMCAWLGGLFAIVALLPAATRRLEPPERTRLLAATLVCFSPIALLSVAALLATGVGQAIVHLERFGDLLHTAFGRAILTKALLLVALIGLGALNRQRSVPRLRALAADGQAPGEPGRVLRATIRTEVALIAVVLGVTAALVSYAPPSGQASSGPVSRETRLGPLDLQLTVDPATVGANQVHLYLFRARDGAPFDGTKELTIKASLPGKGIPPVDVEARKAGPGHYVATGAQLAPAGDWRLDVTDRVSDFDEYSAKVEVPVR